MNSTYLCTTGKKLSGYRSSVVQLPLNLQTYSRNHKLLRNSFRTFSWQASEVCQWLQVKPLEVCQIKYPIKEVFYLYTYTVLIFECIYTQNRNLKVAQLLWKSFFLSITSCLSLRWLDLKGRVEIFMVISFLWLSKLL